MVTIFFDNVSPTFTNFNLGGGADYTSTATISLDNSTASDNGSGVMEYLITESTGVISYTSSGWTSVAPNNYTFDNGTNEEKTVYIYARDRAGNLSDNSSASIVFDNSTPVIDNLTLAPSGFVWIGSVGPGGAYPSSANATLYLSAHDNDSTDNFSSGWKDFCVVYDVTRAGSSIIDNGSTSSSSCSWTSTGLVSSDNYSFDNLSITLSFTSTSASGGYLDNSSSNSTDNLTVVVWMRDNASNVSGNFTTVFSLDNQSIWYNP
jgi:hypothetical protein